MKKLFVTILAALIGSFFGCGVLSVLFPVPNGFEESITIPSSFSDLWMALALIITGTTFVASSYVFLKRNHMVDNESEVK